MRKPKKEFTVFIETGNSAFDENPKQVLASLLEEVAVRLRNGDGTGLVKDPNGNLVGFYKCL